MKYIEKRSEPHELRAWKRDLPIGDDGKPYNTRYKHLESHLKETLLVYLLEDQGYICCYTGMRVTATSSHIEHFKPRSQCVDLEEIDYENLLAAYPKPESGKPGCPFGAEAKKDDILPITPLRRDCETRFLFDEDGYISVANERDSDAAESIAVLVLDDPVLTDNRGRAIRTVLYPKGRTPSEKYLERVIDRIYEKDHRDRLTPHCVAIFHAAHHLLRRIRSSRKRKRYTRKDQS